MLSIEKSLEVLGTATTTGLVGVVFEFPQLGRARFSDMLGEDTSL